MKFYLAIYILSMFGSVFVIISAKTKEEILDLSGSYKFTATFILPMMVVGFVWSIRELIGY